MNSKFVKERKAYSQSDLYDFFECDDEEQAIELIKRLKSFNILKAIKNKDKNRDLDDLQDEDFDISDVELGDNERKYLFSFVGVVVISGIVLKCYPKYISDGAEPLLELKQILRVLEKNNSKNEMVKMFNDSNDGSSFNLLAVLLFILQDYFENGIYTNTEDIIESNGSGEILWDKTINETFAIISDSRPYYIDLKTAKRVNDDYDYFKRLHECIVTKASNELKRMGLNDLFELMEVDLTDEKLDEFGDKDFILYSLEKELNQQFNTRKQLVLKTIYTYISNGGSLNDIDCMSLFGTNSFNLVWEDVCKEILGNKLEYSLGDLKLPIKLKEEYDPRMQLLELIEKPLWTETNLRAKDTLVPDLITIAEINGVYQFIIFDAKYYTPRLIAGKTPKRQPGIESITKQYLYQLAYKKFILDHNFSEVKNCFLLPTEESKVEDKGIVRLEMLSNLGLNDIQVRFIPAMFAYELYLDEDKMSIEDLML